MKSFIVYKSVVYASDFLSPGVGSPPPSLIVDFLANGFFYPGVNLAILEAGPATDSFLIAFDFLATPPTTLGLTALASDFNAAAPFSCLAIAAISTMAVLASLNP